MKTRKGRPVERLGKVTICYDKLNPSNYMIVTERNGMDKQVEKKRQEHILKFNL